MWKPCPGQGFRFFSISKDMGPEGRLSALVRGALTFSTCARSPEGPISDFIDQFWMFILS